MPYLHANEIALYYEVHAPTRGSTGERVDAPALVLGHGAGGHHQLWWPQVEAFRDRYRVVVYDHRGFGRSHDVPGGPGRRAFALDLYALLDHLGIDEFAFVAHSMAGRTATPFAALFPGRIRALVLSGGVGGIVDDAVRRERAANAARVAGQSLRSRALAPQTERDRPHVAARYRELNAMNPARRRTFLAPPRGMSHWQGTALGVWGAQAVPLLFVVGEHDAIVSPSMVRAAHAAVEGAGHPDATYAEIPNAGHSTYFEQPAAFNAAVGAFFDRVWPGASLH